MPIIKTQEAMGGMILETPIYCPDTNKLLLKEGTKLTNRVVDIILLKKISTICVVDQYNLSINPNDTMRYEAFSAISQIIKKYAPHHKAANKSDNMVLISQNALLILNKILVNETVLDYCTQMKITDKSLLIHSYNVCGLSLLLAGAMELTSKEMFNIGTAALIHDLGMLEMPFLIGVKQRSSKEEDLYKEHTTYGYYIGNESGITRDISSIVYAHHEYWNGSGFPRQLQGEDIPIGSRIISVCDSFDSMVRFQDLPSHYAIEYLYGGGGFYFDSKVSTAFLNNIAIYPLGSLVKLSTGETGVVVNVRKNSGDRPIVNVYYNRSNRKNAHQKHIDLGIERTVFIVETL